MNRIRRIEGEDVVPNFAWKISYGNLYVQKDYYLNGELVRRESSGGGSGDRHRDESTSALHLSTVRSKYFHRLTVDLRERRNPTERRRRISRVFLPSFLVCAI